MMPLIIIAGAILCLPDREILSFKLNFRYDQVRVGFPWAFIGVLMMLAGVFL